MQNKVTAVSPTWGRRLAGIEGLRGVAAVSVVFYHLGITASPQTLGGPTRFILTFFNQGLTLFFVLSGFLLYRPFITSILKGERLPSIRRYAYNRVLRIYPAYLVIFTVTGVLFGYAYLHGSTHGFGPDNIGRLTDPLRIVANALLVQMFIPAFVMSGLPVSWSLTAELTFYLVLPAVSIVTARRVRRGASKHISLVVAPLCMIILGLGLTSWAHLAAQNMTGGEVANFTFGQTGTAVLLRSFLAHADLFAYGMLAAVAVAILHERGLERVPTSVKSILIAGAAIMVVLSIILAPAAVSNVAGAAAAVALVAVVLPSARGDGANRIARVLEWSPVRFMGVISFSLYLWHLPVLLWLMKHHLTAGVSAVSLPATGLCVLAIAVPLSSASYYFVEKPALRLKKSSAKIPTPPRVPELVG